MRMRAFASIDTTAARAAPGVLAVLTGADIVADGLEPDSARRRADGRARSAACG